MHSDVERYIATEEELKGIVARLGRQISADYRGKNPLFVGVLRGCFIFMADLVRACDIPCTLSYLKNYMMARKPNSIRIVTLLDKPDRRVADIKADYAGFTIPDAFVVGYGLDYDEKYRNLPYIGLLKPEIYS